MEGDYVISVSVGIFFGAVFLGLIYLYVNTRERWNWSRIAKRTMVVWASPDIPDTFDRWDDDIGGAQCKGSDTALSSSVRR